MLRLRPSSRSLLFALCSVLLVLPAFAQKAKTKHAPKHVKEQIEAFEEQWKDATLAGDFATMDKLLSEDYVGISWTGQVNTKAMQIDRTRTHTVAISQMELNDMKIKVVGSVAIVTCRADVTGTNDGSRIDGGFRYTRIYQRQPSGAWKITNFESTRLPNPDRQRRHGLPPPPPASSTPQPPPNQN